MPVIDLGSVVGPQGPQGAAGATGAQGIQGNPGPNQVTNQTSTNLNGVLFGNQSKVTVKPVDATPTADSGNLVSSGGVKAALDERIPVLGMGRNLLDNWYFVGGGSQLGDGVFPINQRGRTSYSGNTVYSIDRWQTWSDATLTVAADCCTYSGGSNASLGQKIAIPEISGRKVTASILKKDGTLVTASGTAPLWTASDYTGLNLPGFTLQLRNGSGNHYYIALIKTTGDLVAVKLELGEQQTLCHNEGTAEVPVWVLNEIPDFGAELAKCQRYFYRFGGNTGTAPGEIIGFGFYNNATQVRGFIPLPVTLRGNATISSNNINVTSASGTTTLSNLQQLWSHVPNGLSVQGTAAASGVQSNVCMIRLAGASASYLEISADL